MADIKTKDVVKGTIKKIDKAAIAADRMRSAYVQTKERAEHARKIGGYGTIKPIATYFNIWELRIRGFHSVLHCTDLPWLWLWLLVPLSAMLSP